MGVHLEDLLSSRQRDGVANAALTVGFLDLAYEFSDVCSVLLGGEVAQVGQGCEVNFMFRDEVFWCLPLSLSLLGFVHSFAVDPNTLEAFTIENILYEVKPGPSTR